MKDTIYREDAIGACAYETIECYEARKAIRALPSADRPQGEWITEERDSIYGKKIRLKCSECGDIFDVSEKAFPYERFCRYCGCRMKGADDE